jgi:hypothetical protein
MIFPYELNTETLKVSASSIAAAASTQVTKRSAVVDGL